MGTDRPRPGAAGDTPDVALIIPFRDRGRDPRRQANLDAVLAWWADSPWDAYVVSDGRTGDAQFNRHAAYNLAAQQLDVDVLVYTEADMLLPFGQMVHAIRLAAEAPGLVVPFTQYRYLSEADSDAVRGGVHPAAFVPESVMDNGASIGAINVLSRQTLEAVGQWDDKFEGNWYDDSAARLAFDTCAGPTRWVEGPGFHLYHLPGWAGDHLTDEDRAATQRNRERCGLYEQAWGNPSAMRELTTGIR